MPNNRYVESHTSSLRENCIQLSIFYNDQEIEISNLISTFLQISNNFITNSNFVTNNGFLLQRKDKLSITIQVKVAVSYDSNKNAAILLWQDLALNGMAVMHTIRTSKQQIIEALFCVQNYNTQYDESGLQIVSVTLKSSGSIEKLVT